MSEEYRIVQPERPDDAMWSAIGGGLHQYNVEQGGDPHGRSICFMLYAPDESIAGGLIGELHWGWLYVNLLFIKAELRGQGYGDRLLALAEEAARQHGATHAYLDTFSFQAPEFYKERGYQVFGELKDFPPGHQRYYMVKQL